MDITKGFTIERAGLTSNEMLYTSLINDLCKDGAFVPVYTNTGGQITSHTLKATLEFAGDLLYDTQPWRILIDGTIVDPATPGTGGQIVVGTAIQLPNNGKCYTLDGVDHDGEVLAGIAGKVGVTKSVVSGFSPMPDMFSFTMKVSGGILNNGGQITYIRDSDPNLLLDLSTMVSSTIYIGISSDGTGAFTANIDPTAIGLLLMIAYTNNEGVYDVKTTNINWQSVSFVEPSSINQATPYSYRLVVTSRGICIETWQNANFAERYFSWMTVQRLVDPLSGHPLDTGHSPVVCTYSFSNSSKPYLYEMVTSSILKIIVREHDVLCPSAPTVVSNNSDYVNAMFNPMKQVATSESNQYYIIFPSGMNTQRHLYNEEMDLIAYTSAGVISQWNEASVNVYGEASVSIKDIKKNPIILTIDIPYIDPGATTDILNYGNSVGVILPSDIIKGTGESAICKGVISNASRDAVTNKFTITITNITGDWTKATGNSLWSTNNTTGQWDHIASVPAFTMPADSPLVEGARLTYLDTSSDPLGILSCAFIRSITYDSSDHNKAMCNLYELNGSFQDGGMLKIGGVEVGIADGNSIIVNRKYKGGSANYGTAEGMRIMFMIWGSGIEKDYGIVVGITNIPDTPTNVVTTQDLKTTDVVITWDVAATSVAPTTFNVYRSKTDGFSISSVTNVLDKQIGILPIDGSTSGTATFTGQDRETTYYYSVVAVGEDGTSLASTPASILIRDIYQPKDLVVVPGAWENTLTWTPVTNATKYSVYWSKADPADTTTHAITGIINDIAGFPYVHGDSTVANTSAHLDVSPFVYTYQVTSWVPNSLALAVESIKSTSATGIAIDPTIISNIVANPLATGFEIDLTWDAHSDAISYDLYFSVSTITNKALATKVSVATNAYRHTSLAAGNTYFYRIEAVYAGGITGVLSTEMTAVVLDPKQPAGVTVVGNATSAVISWDPVVGASGYAVYHDTNINLAKGGGTAFVGVTSPAHTYTYTKPAGDAAGTIYYFAVTATTSLGESILSAKVNTTIG